MKKITIAILAILVVVAIGFGINKKVFSKKVDKIQATNVDQVRVIKSVSLKNALETDFLLGFAEETGFFKKHNLKVENIVADSYATQVMASGNADVYVGGIGGVLNDYLNGLDLKWIQTTTNHPYNMVAISKFSKGEESKIKNVAVTRLNGGNHLQVIDALQKLGIDINSVKFVETPIASRAQMLEDGQIDFTVLDADFSDTSAAYQRLKKFTVYEPNEIFTPSVAVRGIATTSKTLNEKSDALKDFAIATKETLSYADQHPAEVIQYVQNKFNFSKENAEKFYANYQLSRKNVDPVPNTQLIVPAAEIMKKEFKVSNPDRDLKELVYSNF